MVTGPNLHAVDYYRAGDEVEDQDGIRWRVFDKDTAGLVSIIRNDGTMTLVTYHRPSAFALPWWADRLRGYD